MKITKSKDRVIYFQKSPYSKNLNDVRIPFGKRIYDGYGGILEKYYFIVIYGPEDPRRDEIVEALNLSGIEFKESFSSIRIDSKYVEFKEENAKPKLIIDYPDRLNP